MPFIPVRLNQDDIKTINCIKERIDAEQGNYYTIQQLATLTGMSESKLKFGFKKIYGLTLHRYFNSRRMQHAMLLLSDNHKKLFAIARASGYRHLSTFITAFKKYHGNTPGYYRTLQDEY